MELLIILLFLVFLSFREYLHYQELVRKDAMLKDLELKLVARTSDEYVKLKATENVVEEMDDDTVEQVYDLDGLGFSDLESLEKGART